MRSLSHVRLPALAALALLLPVQAAMALARPVPTGPAVNATVTYLPSFAWKPVAGAAKYQFQVAGDAGFASIVWGAGTPFTTRNTVATVKDGLQPAAYWWRVRAIDETGAVTGPWTAGRRFVLSWAGAPQPLAPDDASSQAYPEPVVLKWQTVPAAVKYRVWIGTDPALATLVTQNGDPIETAATEWTVTSLLPASQRDGSQTTTYYWKIAPLDSRGYAGPASGVRSFVRTWDATTTPTATDASPEASLFTPRLTWTPVAGAAAYEVEINAAPNGWASSGKVCCTDPTVATTLVPTGLLANNGYRWRVRPIDGAGNAGDWSYPAVPAFTKDFNADKVHNLRVRDNLVDPADDRDGGTAGLQVSYPIVQWDPVDGADSYRFSIAPYDEGLSRCDWQQGGWLTTVSTAVTLLANRNLSYDPPLNPNGVPVANAPDDLVNGQKYCAKVEAVQGKVNITEPVVGPAKLLDNGLGWSFQYVDPAAPAEASCRLELCDDQYLLPVHNTGVSGMPLFTWKAVTGAHSYWIYVFRDASLTNPIDVALTSSPAYAPRKGSPWNIIHDQEKTYDEEDTGYYWIVIPASGYDGTGAFAPDDSAPAFPHIFQKQTPAPSIADADLHGSASRAPVFRWSPSRDAKTYRLEYSTNPAFPAGGGATKFVSTVSPEYVSLGTLPSGKWYWRVQGYDFYDRGLGWSATADTTVTLPTPVTDPANPTGGDAIPTWAWSSVPGALGYQFYGTDRKNGHPQWDAASAATTPLGFTGPGTITWKVRAVFQGATALDKVYGPWTVERSYNKLMSAPASLHVTRPNGGLLVTWAPKPQAFHYVVDIASDAAFLNVIESQETETPNYAPQLDSLTYRQGGPLYVRVAQYDEDSNRGAYSQTTPSKLPYAIQVDVRGVVNVRKWSSVVVTVKDPRGRAVPSATVRIVGAGNRIRSTRTSRRGTATAKVYVRKGGKFRLIVTRAGYVAGVYEGYAV